ncbi:MAG: lycopene cyclase domain-containing protein [Candidatus Nanopelagicaceae bacterium]
MSYTQLALLAVPMAILFDLLITRRRMILRRAFWTSYAIILPFQLLTNWWLTSREIVMYREQFITGFRIASAPVEDLLFGFALILGVITLWIYWGARGVQQERG